MDQLPELTSHVDLSLFVHLLPLLDMIPHGRDCLTLRVSQTWHSNSRNLHLDPSLPPLAVMTSDEEQGWKQGWEHEGSQGWLDLLPCRLSR